MLNKFLKKQEEIKSLINRENGKNVGQAMAVAFYLANDKDTAGQWIKIAHGLIQGVDTCCCGNAEWLGKVANVIERTDIANYIISNTYCKRSEPQWARGEPAVGINYTHSMSASDWDREYILCRQVEFYVETLDKLLLSRE